MNTCKYCICPKCKSHLFFQAHLHQNAFKEPYAMCKWCGYWKKGQERAKHCKIFYHNCPNIFRRHPRKGYCWGFGESVLCEICKQQISNEVKWPFEDEGHPFWAIALKNGEKPRFKLSK